MILLVQLIFCFLKEVLLGSFQNYSDQASHGYNDTDSGEASAHDQNTNMSSKHEHSNVEQSNINRQVTGDQSLDEAMPSLEQAECVLASNQLDRHHLQNGFPSSGVLPHDELASVVLTKGSAGNSLVSDSWDSPEANMEANLENGTLNRYTDASHVSNDIAAREPTDTDDSRPQHHACLNSVKSDISHSMPVSESLQGNDYPPHFVTEQDWLDEFESLFYAENMGSDLKSLIHKALSMNGDPFSFALYAARHADFDLFKYSNKKSLSNIVLTEFESWLQARTKGKSLDERRALGLEPTDKHKDSALELVVTEKLFLFELVKKLYKLDSGDNGFLDKHLRFLLHSRKKYKEAATFAYKLNLQRIFELSEILVPLVILDKLQLAESYVTDCPPLQKEFLAMLDEFCGMTDEELENVVEMTISPKPKEHRLKGKTLVKFSERMVKMFHLRAEDYPNVYREKNLNGLKYLLHKKYSEKGMSSKKWDDLLETAIGDKEWLKHELVDSLLHLGDVEEAARWTEIYGLSLDCVPKKVRDLLHNRRQYTQEDEDWDGELRGTAPPRLTDTSPYRSPSSTVQYLRLSLSQDRILLVTDSWSLEDCLRTICMPGSIIGFDAEWRPVMCRAGSDDRLAIIQLATWREVFILDMMALPENVEERELRRFANEVFANPQVLKLGYGIESDFQILASSCPPFKDALDRACRFVDLCPLSKEVLQLPNVRRRVQAQGRLPIDRRGLSELIYFSLGLPLDKTYQISDWERRPLTTEQLQYAALDAFCLLEAYEVLKSWAAESGISVNMEPKLHWQKPENEKRKDARRKRPKPGTLGDVPVNPVHRGKVISPRSLSVVTDTMLQGLGRHLRCCGVNVVILDNGKDHAKTAEIAKRENRAILTSGTPYYTLRSQVPASMCMCVPAGNTRQQVAAVFKYFNVKVTTSDIFSRCQVCNGDEYIEILPDDMKLALDIFNGRTWPPPDDHVPRDCPINLRQLTIASGVPLKLAPLPEGVLNKVDLFYCCASCGKIFWEGSHFKKVVNQFSHVLGGSSGRPCAWKS